MKRRLIALAGGIACLCVSGCGSEEVSPRLDDRSRAAVDTAPIQVGEEVASFYRERGYRPIWVRGKSLAPEAAKLVGEFAAAGKHGLDPARYATPELKAALVSAQSGEPVPLVRADLLLSTSYANFVRDLRRAPEASKMVYVDPELAPADPSVHAVLQQLAGAPSLKAAAAAATSVNPLYDRLQHGLAAYRQIGGGDERLIQANLDRARALPADPGRRFILVDAAGARLWMFENGRVADTMRVIVGKNGMETPEMAGLIRFVVLNPYWNVPPDLIRDGVARRVVRDGLGYIRSRRLQVLTDWTPAARVLDPAKVNWKSVASGGDLVRVRQFPGADNMMGKMKFMFPNKLGIYLHDTPNKSLFALADRRISSGCVRVEDAERLARWLFAGAAPSPSGAAEQRVDLPEPVPVYITYLTAVPGARGIRFQPDVYRRDPALLAQLSGPRSRIQLSAR